MIRYFLFLQPLSVGTLTPGAIQPGGKAVLVGMVGTAVLLETRLAATLLTAIEIATVAGAANTKSRATPMPLAFSLAKLDCRGTHAEPKAGLDNGRRSWQARK